MLLYSLQFVSFTLVFVSFGEFVAYEAGCMNNTGQMRWFYNRENL